MSITFREAMANRSANKFSSWPERGPGNRLEPVARPSFETGIVLNPNAVVMTMGSCFARNIEEYLDSNGYQVPVLGYSAPANEYGAGNRVSGILNKYTAASIVQEFDWLLSVKIAGGIVDWEHVRDLAFQTGDDLFIDLQLSSGHAVTKARLIERRQAIYDIHSRFFNCDLAIITPGLTEAWLDTKTGLFIQQPPTRKMLSEDPTRFQFEALDFFKCYAMMEKVVLMLQAQGTTQIAFTVSPVPLANTFTKNDVLIANTYSKAILRAVVGALYERYDFVRYIPSFEMVMLTKGKDVWCDDLRHVSDGFVGGIVRSFTGASSATLDENSDKIVRFNSLCESEDWDQALEIYNEGLADRTDIMLFAFHRNAAKLFVKKNMPNKTAQHAKIIQALEPANGAGYLLEMRARARLKDKAGIQAAAKRGSKACGKKHRKRIAALLEKLA